MLQKTGCWVEEVAAPYFVFKNAGCAQPSMPNPCQCRGSSFTRVVCRYEVVIASIKGGTIPFDEASLSGDFFTPAAQRFQSK